MMKAKEITTNKGNRIHWLDNLRTITILLVVLYHVGGVYEAAGLWASFWIVDDPNTIRWVGIVGIIFDVMVMPLMFFISGYLTHPSLESKSGLGFVKGKIKRLMVPWAIAVFTLIPLYKFIFLYSRGLPQEHWSTYFHITNANSQNWLWFLPVLFSFDMLYLLLSKINIKVSNISLKWAVLGTFLIGLAYSFTIGGLLGFRSWTSTPLIDFENERLLLYFMLSAEHLRGKTQEQTAIQHCQWNRLASGHGAHLCTLMAFLLSKPGGVSDHTVVSVDLAPEFLPCAALFDVCDDCFILALPR
jgi:surface polysaccharide O-acyltransferase-like enzyme